MITLTSAFNQKCQRVRELINATDYSAAKTALGELEPSSNVECRMALYWASQLELRRGNYDAATDIILTARREYGDHISLLINLLSCYLIQGNVLLWKKTYLEVVETLAKIQDLLSPMTRVKVCLAFGKMQEENGDVAEALCLYEGALQNPEIIGLVEHYSLLAQILRLTAGFRLKTKSVQSYDLLVRTRESAPTVYHSSEIQHALILAESLLVGPGHAISRFQEVIAKPGFSDFDRSLIFFDLLEEFLTIGNFSGAKTIVDFGVVPAQDAFENAILKMFMISSGLCQENIELNSLFSQTSPANLLRLLSIHSRIITDDDQTVESRRRLQCLMEPLSAESRELWKKRLRSFEFPSKKLTLQLDGNRWELRSASHSLSLKRKKLIWELLSKMSEDANVGVSDLIKHLWNCEEDPSSFDRLRNLVFRTNQLVQQNFGCERLFEFRNDELIRSSGKELVRL